MTNTELCNNGRCKRVRLGEERHEKHAENEKFSEKKWKQFQITYGLLMTALISAFTGASSLTDEPITQQLGAIAGVLGLFFAIYIAVWTYKSEYLKKQEITKKTQHAKEEIYSTIRIIEQFRNQRERIRTKNPLGLAEKDFETEIIFVNQKLKRMIESLQFLLLIYSEYLPSKFISRIRDAINGYDFIITRLEVLPFESDDPKNTLSGKYIEQFIDELKEIK